MGQKWPNCDQPVKQFVYDALQILEKELANNLDAVILHGSLAMGSFYPPKSDIDLLILVQNPINEDEQKRIHSKMIKLTEKRPIIGFLEFSIVLSQIAKAPVHPIHYELHFGEEFPEKIKSGRFDYANAKGRDPDLAAHFTVAKNRGISLYGDSPNEILGDINWTDYLDSVLDDLSWILSNDHILESPFYSVLNSCRVLEMIEKGCGTVSSKEEAGLWALKNLPSEHSETIRFALDCYRSDGKILASQRQKAGVPWDEDSLIAFRDFVAKEISKINS